MLQIKLRPGISQSQAAILLAICCLRLVNSIVIQYYYGCYFGGKIRLIYCIQRK
jgi:hypothetical protein